MRDGVCLVAATIPHALAGVSAFLHSSLKGVYHTMTHTPDELVLTCLERLKPLLSQLARNYRLDQDDLVQEAACLILETLPKIDLSRDPVPYLRIVVRRQIWFIAYRKNPFMSSLEEQTEDGLALKDTLSDTSTLPDEQADRRKKATHAALRRLPLDEQLYMRQIHALSFDVINRGTRPLNRTRKAIGPSAYAHLRADQKLMQAVL